ncbi:hypothetical protein HHO41_16000 [Bacillus sp. DNRA2]|uniref:hypothetical protein n=1 Tax=Bacillus sp. DNRA2 TaxID=2723053 RepID=UPI00145D0D11|nr:hypothetical protein [Bacillus sp. DNRA2]NMD71801.1 hypothetical protein [Bacillus sp. DNRA2]
MIKKIIIPLLGLLLIPCLAFANGTDKLGVEMQYIVVSPTQDGSTQIMDMVSYKNLTNEEYKGDGKSEGVISVTLPEGAQNLKMLEESIKYKETDNGFVTTEPIPADKSITVPFTYSVPKGQDIAITFNLPVPMYQVLVPEGMGSVEFKDVDAQSQGFLSIDEKNYFTYTVQNIQANQTITLAYNKDVQPPSEGTNTDGTQSETKDATDSTKNGSVGNVTKTAPDFHNPGHLRMWEQSALKGFDPHILMIVLGTILIAGIGYFSYFKFKNRASSKAIDDKDEQAFKLLMAKQKTILDKILELEETLEKGQISESDYQAKLEAYKQHLVQVKLSLNQFVE